MNKKQTIPKLPLRFFRWYCHPDFAEDIEGDLIERFERNTSISNLRSAKWAFTKDVIRLFRPGIIRSLTTTQKFNNYVMFKNYFKVGLRNLLKYKVFSFINIFGLAAAMSISMIIILMLSDQKSYDQFHVNKDRTYRILTQRPGSSTSNASSPLPLAAVVMDEYNVAGQVTQLLPKIGGDLSYNNHSIEIRGFFADSHFFDVFGFDLVKGKIPEALSLPHSIVITSEQSYLLFQDQNPIGKSVELTDRGLKLLSLDKASDIGSSPKKWGLYTITGVIDRKKHKSHLKFDALVSMSSLPVLYSSGMLDDHTDDWAQYSYCYNYIVLNEQSREQDLTTMLNDLAERKYAGFEKLKGLKLIPQPLTSITPGTMTGNPTSLSLPIEAYYFLGFLALVIMVSACLNYTNLSIARALTRSREIGIRKVSGASKRHLIFQFLSESILTVLFALILANILLVLIKPAFLGLWVNQYLNFDLQGNILVYIIFLVFALLVGILSGIYPALNLSRYSPSKVLKSINSEKTGKLGIRKALSTFQFVVSLFFIITSILVARQSKHFINFDYGFDTENIVNIPMQGNDYQLIFNQLSTVPGVMAISACEFIPATDGSHGMGIKLAGNEEDYKTFESIRVDSNFVMNTMGLDILAGKNFGVYGSQNNQVLVNEAAVEALGFRFAHEITGQTLAAANEDEPLVVVGVIRDFKYQSPAAESEIKPLILRNQPEYFSFVNIKIAPGKASDILSNLEDKWKQLDPVHPFKYQFFDDQLAMLNQWLDDVVSIIGLIAFMSITIACLGIFGMAIYTTERKRKEVSIRKVFGAENINIAFLLSKTFLKILFVAVVIGAPLSYLLNNLWLENLPNRVDFGLGTMLSGSCLLLSIGIITIASQVVRVANSNPAHSLKDE